jgi:hypothetical protein
MLERHEKHNKVYKNIIYQWQAGQSPDPENNFAGKYEILK